MEERNDIVIYKSDDGLVKMEAMVDPINETIWASQKAIAALFDCTKQNVSYHIGKIFASGELDRSTVVKEILTTALSIIKTISQHNDYIFNVLNEGVTEEVKVSETYSSAARASLLSILPDQFTSKDMKAAAVKISKSLRTVERQVRRAIQKGQVKELGKGSYQKIS